ncbi:MAG: putative amidohydrolase YtcJ [Porticoccus sp.]|jgi:predicted amidohydrolase YtcJ
MKKFLLVLLFLLVMVVIIVYIKLLPAQPLASQAFINGTVLTMDSQNSIAEAVVIENDKIVAVGSLQKVKPYMNGDTVVYDLAGKTLMPGFIDAHGHFPASGINYYIADLNSPPIGAIKNIPELITALKAKYAGVDVGEWIVGYGYDDTSIVEHRHITIQELDNEFPDNPVFILHISGHMAVLNSQALKLIDVDKNTPDMDGGVYVKDGNGELTGLVEETAALHAQMLAMDFGALESLNILQAAVKEYSAKGVTSAQAGAVESKITAGLVAADKLNLIPMRVNLWPIFDQFGEDFLSGKVAKEDYKTAKLDIGAIKIIADGSIQGYTGYLSKPYHVQPLGGGHSADHGDSELGSEKLSRGYPRVIKEDLIEWVSKYHKAGYQMAIHGNGDAAIDDIIDAFALAQQENYVADPRLILIHAQMAREDQLVRMKELGITPSFFSAHTYYWGDRHRDIFMGPERAARMSPTKSALDLGLRFSIHLDAPIVPMDPLLGVWATVNRLSTSGKVIGPEQRLSVMQALRATTIDAAWQIFKEDQIGSIEAGKFADLVVLNQNPLDVPTTIKDINVIRTVVGGVTTYKQ